VLSHLEEDPPEVDQSSAIEPQSLDGGPSHRGHTNNQSAVLGPGEMRAPHLCSGMEQGNGVSGHRIEGVSLLIFVIVAPLAGDREVYELRHREKIT
jgi:hypothetical protein